MMAKRGPMVAGQPLSKDEQKMRDREDQIRKEIEQADAARKQKEEMEQVRKEAKLYRSSIDELQRRIKRQGENIANWFNMFDSDRDGLLEPEDFKRLLKQAGVVVRD